MSTNDKIRELTLTIARELEDSLDVHVQSAIGTPIEKLMRWAFTLREMVNLSFVNISVGFADGRTDLDKLMWHAASHKWQLMIVEQLKIDNYRPDFVAIMGTVGDGDLNSVKVVAIECDGHNFHEKTKEQAARDKSKDRYLTARGVTVMRYAGSEVWADAMKCVNEVVSLFENWAVERGQIEHKNKKKLLKAMELLH
jgi:very-short-patch-repair endonuclease